MPTYSYRARQEDGKLIRGTLRAADQNRATKLLGSHNLVPVSIEEVKESVFTTQFNIGSVGTRDLILFFRQTASMIRAGVPVLQSLNSLQMQTDRTALIKVLQDMSYDVKAGSSLSIAMSKHPHIFDPFMLGITRTGEASGKLSDSMAVIANYLEEKYDFQQKLRAALIYPVFLLAVVILLSITMFTFVLPQLVTLFSDAGVQLPLPTRALIFLVETFQSYWYFLVAFIVVFGLIIRSYINTPEGRYILSTYMLRTPIINKLIQKVYLSRMTSILFTLFSSDVPVLEALGLTRDAVGNRVYQRMLNETVDAVKDGASISSVWKNELFIPPMLTAIIGIGEESGDIATAFKEANRFFKRDVARMLQTITIMLEPVLILILGAGVGIVVAAILLPIYNLVLVI